MFNYSTEMSIYTSAFPLADQTVGVLVLDGVSTCNYAKSQTPVEGSWSKIMA